MGSAEERSHDRDSLACVGYRVRRVAHGGEGVRKLNVRAGKIETRLGILRIGRRRLVAKREGFLEALGCAFIVSRGPERTPSLQ